MISMMCQHDLRLIGLNLFRCQGRLNTMGHKLWAYFSIMDDSRKKTFSVMRFFLWIDT